jgi:hypothetical protein
VQSTILKNAESVRAIADFIAKTIDRLKAITGPKGRRGSWSAPAG